MALYPVDLSADNPLMQCIERIVLRLCAERGMRMTGQRRVIAKVLSEADDHPDEPARGPAQPRHPGGRRA